MASSNQKSVTIDASVLVALCAREKDKYDNAKNELQHYSHAGYRFFAPGVIVAEVLFVLCKKLTDEKTLTAIEHANAVEDLSTYMTNIASPPEGDASLVQRAEQIRAGYGCSRSADGIYMALTEALAASGEAELLTFDAGFYHQAQKNAPSIKVRELAALPPLSI